MKRKKCSCPREVSESGTSWKTNHPNFREGPWAGIAGPSIFFRSTGVMFFRRGRGM